MAKVVALPEQVTVIGVGGRTGLPQRGGARTRGAHENVEGQGVLIDAAAAAVGADAVVHHVADLVGEIARDLDHADILAANQIDAQLAGQTERRAGLGEALGPVEVLQGRTDGSTQVTELEVPLAGHRARRQGDRDARSGGGAQQQQLSVAQAAGADLDGAHEHLATLVLVAITEKDGRRTHGAA
ncbi:MAG: hypothetical protein RIS24_2317, partial [Verrucomicrobiota bacterium]